MARNRYGTDGELLEWAIQSDYAESVKTLPERYIPRYVDKKGNSQPLLFQHHLGNAAGGKTFMTDGIPDTATFYVAKDGKSGIFYIEFKRHNGKVSPAQQVIIVAMLSAGFDVEVHRSAKTAFDALLRRIGLVDQKE